MMLGQRLSAEEMDAIGETILLEPQVSELVRNHKVRALRIAPTPEMPISTAVAALFDYTTGQTLLTRIDLKTGKIASIRVASGRPPASQEERNEAIRIIKSSSDRVLQLLNQSAVLEGGFIVDPPNTIDKTEGAPHRYIQFQLLSKDRAILLELFYVDLTTETIVTP